MVQSGQNSNLLKDIIYFLFICKFNKDRINNNREKVETSSFRRSRAAYSVVSRRVWLKFELIQALMHVLINCKYQKDRIKNDRKKWRHHLTLYKYILDVQGQITPQLVVRSDRHSDWSKRLCKSFLPAKLKKKWSNINRENVETSIFRRSMAANWDLAEI